MLEGKHYKISRNNITAHELIGLDAEIISGTEKSRNGLKGCIVNETKNLLIMETEKGTRHIPKKESVFAILLGHEAVKVEGKNILARPEDRTKFAWRNKE